MHWKVNKIANQLFQKTSYYIFVDESVVVLKGSALQALEGSDGECIEKLISALDNIPLPMRLQVVHFC